MTPDVNPTLSRRQLGVRAAQLTAATALAGVLVPNVHAAGDSTIQVALIGCGGRGTGAAADALRVKGAKPKLVAMADVFKDRLDSSYRSLTAQDEFGDRVDVPDDRKFIGFDAYKHALDYLKPGDIAIFATPLAFRAPQFEYAIEKRLNVFMEKPLSADGVKSKRLLKAGEDASAKGLKVAVGLMSRHARPMQELQKRIEDKAIGEIILMRAYRMHGPAASFESLPKPENMTDLEYQIRRFHSFLWASGGCFSDFNIHTIDHLSWMKGAWPVKAQGVGGRHYKTNDAGVPWVDQNFDSYGIEYTFADNTKMFFDGRCIDGAQQIYYSAIHGTNGFAIGSAGGDCGAPSSIFKGSSDDQKNKVWQSTDNSNPYQNEWNDFIEAINKNTPYNEVKRGVEASLVTSMGRMAAHTGQEISFDQMLNSDHEFAPGVDTMTKDSPAPVLADAKGIYPQPMPGKKKREY